VGCNPRSRFLAQRLLLDGSGMVSKIVGPNAALEEVVNAARQRLADSGVQLAAIESMSRYRIISELTEQAIKRPSERATTLTDRIDRVLTNRIWGVVVFIVVMVAIFQAIFVWSVPLMDGIDGSVGWLADTVGGWMPEGAFRSLVTDGNFFIGLNGNDGDIQAFRQPFHIYLNTIPRGDIHHV